MTKQQELALSDTDEPAAAPVSEEERKQAEIEMQRKQAAAGYPPANASWAGDEFLQYRLPNCS